MIEFQQIGIIHTPFNDLQGMPIQPPGGSEIDGTIEIYEKYSEGLKDLHGFSHIILLYLFHASRGYNLTITPFMDSEPRGLFATRAPKRPNPIGLSVVRILKVETPILHIKGIDVLDGTPLLDIKPYVPEFDHPSGPIKTGWLEKSNTRVCDRRSDDRFKK